ncbi:MAG TPA: carboxymuconolactone decarboxylase family protein [Micromonosporaceae bacterium]|jgi:AhpD family alkylhydroperoxidase|nr:carboxymuconolactone decarboxylase family protein [Micromonosporaceae bacterium]
MTARMDIGALQPAAYKAMLRLDSAVQTAMADTPFPSPFLELLRLRASQINGCAYCVDMHSADAKAAGESDPRLFAVAVWQEAPFFTEQERAALALTEAMTRLSDGGDRVPDEVWNLAARMFDGSTLAALVMAITTINAWNRICVSTRMVPSSYKE